MGDPTKRRRLESRIHHVVAEGIGRSAKDPRLAPVTITDVSLTPDWREATVFYTVLGDGAVRDDARAALGSATGVLRSAVGRALGIRHTPSLAFVPDPVPDRIERLDVLMAEARAADAERARAARDATYAGSPDPYKHAEDETEPDTAAGEQ